MHLPAAVQIRIVFAEHGVVGQYEYEPCLLNTALLVPRPLYQTTYKIGSNRNKTGRRAKKEKQPANLASTCILQTKQTSYQVS